MGSLQFLKIYFRTWVPGFLALAMVLMFPLRSFGGLNKCGAADYHGIIAGTCLQTTEDGSEVSIVGVSFEGTEGCKDISNVQLDFTDVTLAALNEMASLEIGLNALDYDVVLNARKGKTVAGTLKIDTAFDTASTTFFAAFDGTVDLSVTDFYLKTGSSLLSGMAPDSGLVVTPSLVDYTASIIPGEVTARDESGNVTEASTQVRITNTSGNTSSGSRATVRVDTLLENVTIVSNSPVSIVNGNTFEVNFAGLDAGDFEDITLVGPVGTGITVTAVSIDQTDADLCSNIATGVLKPAPESQLSIDLLTPNNVRLASGEDLLFSYDVSSTVTVSGTVTFTGTNVVGEITGPQDNVSVFTVGADGVRVDITATCTGSETNDGASIECPIDLSANEGIRVDVEVREVSNRSTTEDAVLSGISILSAGGDEVRSEEATITVGPREFPLSIDLLSPNNVRLASGEDLLTSYEVSSTVTVSGTVTFTGTNVVGEITGPQDNVSLFTVGADGVRVDITPTCTGSETNDGASIECPIELSANEPVGIDVEAREVTNRSTTDEAVLVGSITLSAGGDEVRSEDVTIRVAPAPRPLTLEVAGSTEVRIASGGSAILAWDVSSEIDVDVDFVVDANLVSGDVSILPDPVITVTYVDGTSMDITADCVISEETDTSARVTCPLSLSAGVDFTLSATISDIENLSPEIEAVLTFAAGMDSGNERVDAEPITVTVEPNLL